MTDTDTTQCLETITNAAQQNKLTDGAVENITRWLTQPQYGPYVDAICQLINEQEFAELDRLFWEVIAFGTGGRRGPMSDFGSATINPRTIAESAHGLATYLKQSGEQNTGKAVITCDTRNRSDEFSRLTASVLAAHGLHVYYFEQARSTPELSFAVRHLSCDIGVMITASHNPPADNGFKAYWNSGGQVLPPHDKGIVDCVYTAGEIPQVDFDQAVQAGTIEMIGSEIDVAYHNAVLEMSLSKNRGLNAIYTPLHGVGETACFEILKQAGFTGVEILECQREQNGNFPNVDQHMPNPERVEVFQQGIERAKQTGASVILASDPDADRLGVCVRNQSGDFIHLTGNQIGTLIVDHILRHRKAAGSLSEKHFVVETLVTTPLIGKLAKSYNLQVIDDLLVGFKYIGEAIDKYGPDYFVFGAEESLGFLAGTFARDKDAGIASLYLCEAAADLHAEGKSLLDRLDEIYQHHGYFLEGQISKVCTGSSGKAQIDALMATFRSDPPGELAGISLASVRDYAQNEKRELPGNNRIEEIPQPIGNLLFFDSEQGPINIHIAVRPSGTEPKIKFYLFVRAEPNAENLDTTKQQAAQTYQQIKQDLLDWIESKLDK